MDDVIQLLVFIVTFAVFIVSVIIKQKKKSGAKSSNLESIVESFFGVSEPTKAPAQNTQEEFYKPQSDLFENPTNKKEFKKMKREVKQSYYNEGVDAIPDNDENNDRINNDVADDVEPIFDVRQAVIYSEILNRKTY